MSSKHSVHHKAASSLGGLIGLLLCALVAALASGLTLAARRRRSNCLKYPNITATVRLWPT